MVFLFSRWCFIKETIKRPAYVAVHLSSNRSQMTSKCGKNKKVAHEAIAECVTDVLTTF